MKRPLNKWELGFLFYLAYRFGSFTSNYEGPLNIVAVVIELFGIISFFMIIFLFFKNRFFNKAKEESKEE